MLITAKLFAQFTIAIMGSSLLLAMLMVAIYRLV